MLVANLKRDKSYVDLVKSFLEGCELLKDLPTATPVPARTSFSPDALELLSAYHVLLGFKDAVWFHVFCYAPGSPAHSWANAVMDIDGTLGETGVLGADLRSMGMDYCNNEGRETDYTKTARGFMKGDWLAYHPVPAATGALRVTGRPYQSISTRLAKCLWANPTVFPEANSQATSESNLAAILEAALDGAPDKKMWDDTLTVMTACEQ